MRINFPFSQNLFITKVPIFMFVDALIHSHLLLLLLLLLYSFNFLLKHIKWNRLRSYVHSLVVWLVGWAKLLCRCQGDRHLFVPLLKQCIPCAPHSTCNISLSYYSKSSNTITYAAKTEQSKWNFVELKCSIFLTIIRNLVFNACT